MTKAFWLPRKSISSLLRNAKGEFRKNLCARTAATSPSGFSTSQEDDPDFPTAKPFNEIPGPRGLPYIGTLVQYRKGPYSIKKFHHALLERHKQYGSIYKETISGQTTVHLFDPEYIKLMYAHEGKVPHIPPLLETTQMYRTYRDMSLGLGNTNGEQWYRLRSAVQQMMMRPKAVTMFLPQVNEVIEDFIINLQSEINPVTREVDNFRNEIFRWTLESSAYTCFETRLGAIGSGQDSLPQQMINASKKIFQYSRKLRFSLPFHRIISTPTWKKLVKNEDFFFRNGQKLVDETVKTIDDLQSAGKLGDNQYGFLMYLLGKKELSYKDLSIIALSLFSDGLSTTSPTIQGQLYCLAINPEKQERLYEEIQNVAPDRNKPVTAEMINKMSYLKLCIKEGFRFFPIGTEVSRIPQKNMVIGGYQIPFGTHVELNNNMLLRLPEYFEEPDSYIPERWMRDGTAKNIHPYLLLPFGFGPRTCAGRRFAEQEMHVMIIKLLQHFRLEWPSDYKMEQQYMMLLWPDEEPRFRFIERN